MIGNTLDPFDESIIKRVPGIQFAKEDHSFILALADWLSNSQGVLKLGEICKESAHGETCLQECCTAPQSQIARHWDSKSRLSDLASQFLQ